MSRGQQVYADYQGTRISPSERTLEKFPLRPFFTIRENSGPLSHSG